MIQVIHTNNTVLEISKDQQALAIFKDLNIAETIYKLSELYPTIISTLLFLTISINVSIISFSDST